MFTKQAMQEASPLFLLGWRFLLASLVMTLLRFLGLIKLDLKGRNLRTLVLVTILCPVIYFIGETTGISHTTASESGAFLACIPVVAMIASSLILKNQPSTRRASLCKLSFG